MPHRKPLATLDPQSAHSRLTEDMATSSASGLPTDPKDAAANRYGRHIVSRGSIGDEAAPIHSTSSSRKNSLAQNLSGISLSRNDSRRASLASSVSTRRASVPTIHARGSPTAAIPPSLSNPPQIAHSAYINTDELYSGLKTYSFGAPGVTRSSSPDSEIYEPYASLRYTEKHQRPRRSLSSVPTPRDEMEIDEAEIPRHSRAKMRAIDDGGRKPSLPKNPASSPSPPLSAAWHSSEDMILRNENPSTDFIMDDRASTYTFGVPAMYNHSDSEHSSYLDEEPLDHLSTSPITFAHTPPEVGEDEEGRRNSFVVPIGHDIHLRRGSIPLAIPETPRQNIMAGVFPIDDIQSKRKMSRSLDDEINIAGFREHLDIEQPGGSARSEPLSKADWSSFQQQIDARPTPTYPSQPPTLHGEEDDGPDAYSGLNLAYILGSGGSGGPRSSWSSESFVQRRPSVAHHYSGFAGFGLPFGRDTDRRPSVATATGEDTFLRHLQHNDASYALRLEEWTFGKEKADAPGPRLSGLTSGGVPAPTIGPGTYELWRCHVVGRFNVERLALQSDIPKPPQHRMYVKHIPDPYCINRRGGPGVIVHKHSQAKAFSIFRSHDLFKPKQNKASNQGARHLDTSQSILLATKSVQEQYTSTKTTGRLKTHGLLEERSTSTPPQLQPSEGSVDGASLQGGSIAPIRRSRSQSLIRKDKGSRDKGKARGFQRDDKKKKEKEEKDKKEKKKDSTGSQTSSREGSAVGNKGDGFWSRLPGRHVPTHSSHPSLSSIPHTSGSGASGTTTAVNSNTPSTSYSATSTPSSTANSSPTFPENPISDSKPSLQSPPRPRVPSSHSHRIPRSEGDEKDHEEDGEDLIEFRAPAQKWSHAETYESLTPIHHEQARNLLRYTHSPFAGNPRGRFTKIFPRKGGNPSDWLPNSPTTSLIPSPVPWMLTNNSNSREGHMVMSNLNDNFGAVGLVPPRPTPRPVNKPKGRNPESLILPVPDDSVYMLLPLFAGETDSEFQPEDMIEYEVPLEARKYLLVYYVPFDQRTEGAGGKKVEQPVVSHSAAQRGKNKMVFLNSFRVSAHLMSYQDFKGSGIRLPATGLSITGPLIQAQPPDVEPELHRDPIAIAQCSKRDNGIEFLPEGLHKLGLCNAERVEQMVDPDDLDDDDEKVEYKFELNALGRAVVEMAWVGAMAVTSFGTM